MVIGQFQINSSEGDGSEAVRRRRVRRFDRGRLKNRNRMRAYRTPPNIRTEGFVQARACLNY